MQEMAEFVPRCDLEMRLQATPAAVPLVIQTDEEPQVEFRTRFAETRECGDSPAGDSRVTPSRDDPIDGDVLNICGTRADEDIRLGD